MKRSRLFITVLLSLFIFQSAWNIAAAFCIHGNNPDSALINHFGHHVLNQQHYNHTHSVSSGSLLKYLDQINQHGDHLPSVNWVYILPQDTAIDPRMIIVFSPVIFWDQANFYQSPYLNIPIQPPVFSPL
ncbi:cation efflux protein, CzcI-like [Acinetobacter sp. SAAs470]|uniref:cation efflux protein, CzcI-like n=1 Tax=unclassified Acinetobacter TaxID=196816 RepID=UPI0039775707